MMVANNRPRSWAFLAPALVLALVAAACGGSEEPLLGGLSSPDDLRGKTIAVASLPSMATLETRYVLQEEYGLDVSLEGGDVTIAEFPAESLPSLLEDGEVDAAILAHQGAFRLLDDARFRVLSRVTEDMRELTGAPIMDSILLTYPDVAEHKTEALSELSRLLAESVTYFNANRSEVIEAVALDQGVDPEFLRWWFEHQDLALGDRSVEAQERLLATWEAAKVVGDIEDYPELAIVLFNPEREQPEAAANGEELATTMEGDRTTLSLALLDGPARRAALWAIEQGIVTSDAVDLDLTYLPRSSLIEAAPAKQHDVIEATSLLVPLGAARDLDFIVFSAAAQSRSATFLFVRAEPGSN